MSSSEEEEEEIVPTDIQVEIMKRLPIKSLLKFKQVSKQWKSIIKSPRFISDYNKRIQPLNHMFVYDDCEESHLNIFDEDITFLRRITAPMSAESRLFGYSKGLFAFRCRKDELGVSTVVIWNPSIRKSVCIPFPLNSNRLPRLGFTVCNATDPTILKMPHTHDCVDPLQLQIFTLSTGEWRTFFVDPPRNSLFLTPYRKVVDRFIYWLAVEGNHYRILSFDIVSQQFTELCLPPSLTSCASGFGLGFSQHKDSLVVLQWDVSKQEDCVWMMEPGGGQNSFTKLYAIKAPPYALEYSDVIAFRDNGQPIIGIMSSEWVNERFIEWLGENQSLVPVLFPNHHMPMVIMLRPSGPMYRLGAQNPHRSISSNTNISLTFLFYEPDLERFSDIQISGYGSEAGSYTETLLLLDH